MRSALEWAQVRALVADGISEREIARRLGMNRRTVARLARSDGAAALSAGADGVAARSVEPVLRRLLEEWPQIKAPRLTEILRSEYGYTGSLRLVQARLQRLRPSTVRPAQRTGYRPGQVLQLDWAQMATRPTARRARAARLRAGRVAAVLGRADGVLFAGDDDRVVPGGARARVRVAGRGAARVRLRQPARGRRPPRG